MLSRHLEVALKRSAATYPVVTVTGPRQSGKTTLVRNLFGNYDYVSLDVPFFNINVSLRGLFQLGSVAAALPNCLQRPWPGACLLYNLLGNVLIESFNDQPYP